MKSTSVEKHKKHHHSHSGGAARVITLALNTQVHDKITAHFLQGSWKCSIRSEIPTTETFTIATSLSAKNPAATEPVMPPISILLMKALPTTCRTLSTCYKHTSHPCVVIMSTSLEALRVDSRSKQHPYSILNELHLTHDKWCIPTQ